jgi:hypothetical protein
VYREADECVYRKVELEVNACNRHREMLASRRPPPSPTAVLHQEMVLTRAQRQQATAYRIARHDH